MPCDRLQYWGFKKAKTARKLTKQSPLNQLTCQTEAEFIGKRFGISFWYLNWPCFTVCNYMNLLYVLSAGCQVYI